MNTRRYPRTLQEAFGPYTSNHIFEEPKTSLAQWVIYGVSVVAVVVIAWVL